MPKVILDTDLGNDPDDLFAIAYCLGEPAIDLQGLATVGGQPLRRARLAEALLRLGGAGGVPVAAGRPERRSPGDSGTLGNDRVFFAYGEHFGLGRPEPEPAEPEHLALYRSLLARGGEKPVALSIGPPMNLADLIEAEPALARERIGRVVAMGGNMPDPAKPGARLTEYNFSFDPASTNVLLGSGLRIDLVGANLTRRFAVSAAECEELRPSLPEGGASRACFDYLRRYIFGPWRPEEALMHDPLAAVAVAAPEEFEWRPVRMEADASGGLLARFAEEGEETAIRAAVALKDEPKLRERLFAAWRKA